MSLTRYPKEFPCPVCGHLCEVGLTKKDKPYYMCEHCGVQVFIRDREGIKKFSEFKNSDLLKSLHQKTSVDLSALIHHRELIASLENEIISWEKEKPFLGDKNIENKIEELNKKLEKTKTQYFQLLTK